jgi:hypothetical protein
MTPGENCNFRRGLIYPIPAVESFLNAFILLHVSLLAGDF